MPIQVTVLQVDNLTSFMPVLRKGNLATQEKSHVKFNDRNLVQVFYGRGKLSQLQSTTVQVPIFRHRSYKHRDISQEIAKVVITVTSSIYLFRQN